MNYCPEQNEKFRVKNVEVFCFVHFNCDIDNQMIFLLFHVC